MIGETAVVPVVRMRVEHPPERFIDDSDGAPIEQILPDGSRFDKIDVKRTDDKIEVRAHDEGADHTVEITASINEELYRGVTIDGPQRPRDVDEDIRDVLHLVGYTAVDDGTKAY